MRCEVHGPGAGVAHQHDGGGRGLVLPAAPALPDVRAPRLLAHLRQTTADMSGRPDAGNLSWGARVSAKHAADASTADVGSPAILSRTVASFSSRNLPLMRV
jgi:hypothetical protein